MRLLELELQNINSHKNTIIPFEDFHFVSLVGNNGSGKSSIVEGVMFALFGDNRNNINSIVSHGETQGRVKLKFSVSDEIYEVVRIREITKRSGTSKLYVSKGDVLLGDANGSLETNQVIINEIIGVSHDVLRKTVFAIEGDDSNFMSLKSSARKDFVLDLLNLKEYEAYVIQAKKLLESSEAERTQLEKMVFNYETEIASITEDESEVSELKLRVSEAESKLETMRETQKTYESELVSARTYEEGKREVTRIRNELKDVESEVDRMSTKLQSLIDQKASLESQVAEDADTDFTVAIENIEFALDAATENKVRLLSEQSGLKSSLEYSRKALKKIQDRISTVDSSEDSTCDACGSELNESHRDHLVSEGASLGIEVKKIEETLKEVSSSLVEASAKEKQEKETLSRIDARRSHLESVRVEINGLISQMQTGEQAIEAKQGQATLIGETLEGIENTLGSEPSFTSSDNSSHILQLERELSRTEGSIETLERQISKKTAMKPKLKETADNVNQISLDISDYETIIAGCRRDGIPSIILDSVVQTFESNINYALELLTDGMYKVEVEYDNGFDIYITINGTKIGYQSASLGEKTRIDQAIRLALYLLVKSRTGVTVESFIIDEGIGSLDPNGVESVVNCLTKLNKEFPLVVLITHQAAAFEASPQSISITKENGVSEIRVERL